MTTDSGNDFVSFEVKQANAILFFHAFLLGSFLQNQRDRLHTRSR